MAKTNIHKVKNLVSNAPAIPENRRDNLPYVPFGANNLYPELILGLVDNCGPLGACTQRFAPYIAGHGVEFLDDNDEIIDEAQSKWLDLTISQGEDYLLEATSIDIAIMTAKSWHIRYDSRGIPAAVDHIDVSRIRSGKKDALGKINDFYFCSNWRLRNSSHYKEVRIPSYGFDRKEGLIYQHRYHPQNDYYGPPEWIPALADAEVLTRIPAFNRTQIDTGFKPGMLINVKIANKDDADLDQLDEDLEMTYTGEDGKTYMLHASNLDEDIEITKLERGDHAGELDATRKVSKEEIYHTYGMPPILMGVDVSTGLGGQGLAIEQTLEMFTNTRVLAKQKYITRDAKRIIEACGIKVAKCRIRPLIPFEPAKDEVLQRQTYIARTTVGEDRLANGMELFEGPLAVYNDKLISEVLKGSGANDSTDQIDGPDA
jgi:hypothetical protein